MRCCIRMRTMVGRATPCAPLLGMKRAARAERRALPAAGNNTVSFQALSLLFLLTLLGGCSHRAPTAVDLPIYFTCDTHGRIEPCGCFTGQYGGLTRLKTVLDAEAAPSALRLDVGNSAAGPEDYDFIEYRYVLQAFAALHY